jgi:hypothetical protein
MRLPALLALTAVVAVLAACGGSDSPKSSDKPTVPASADRPKVGNVIVDAQGRRGCYGWAGQVSRLLVV